MAWEQRARGGSYYVRKRRRGGRCVSEYIGGGGFANAVAAIDAAHRIERVGEREAERERRAVAADEDAALDDVSAMAGTLATAALLAAGCHTHKGTWRRRRE